MSKPNNIVLITIDCWRGDHLGARDNKPSPTPFLDTLGAESINCTNAFASGGWTRPSMMALFSAEYASHHHGGSLRRVSTDLPLFSEVLQQNGYNTAGFTANPVCGKNGDFQRGFNLFMDLKTDSRQSKVWNRLRKIRGFTRISNIIFSSPFTHRILQSVGIYLDLYEMSASAAQLTGEVLSWLEATPSTPFFCWIHYIDLHWPYRLSRQQKTPQVMAQAWRDRRVYRNVVDARGRFNPGPHTAARWKGQYREELMTVDEHIQKLVLSLKSKGMWENTALIVTSDHGEEFFEHKSWAHSWNQLYDEGLRIPLIIHLPGMSGSQTNDQNVCHLDLAPTILDIADIKPPETMKGISLLPRKNTSKSRETNFEKRALMMEMLGHRNSYQFRLSIRNKTHSYIYDIEHPLKSQLFDMANDTYQTKNIYSKSDARIRQFDELRFNHMAPIIPQLLETKEQDAFGDMDQEMAERLRALGYLS